MTLKWENNLSLRVLQHRFQSLYFDRTVLGVQLVFSCSWGFSVDCNENFWLNAAAERWRWRAFWRVRRRISDCTATAWRFHTLAAALRFLTLAAARRIQDLLAAVRRSLTLRFGISFSCWRLNSWFSCCFFRWIFRRIFQPQLRTNLNDEPADLNLGSSLNRNL